ncbi:LysE family transporter [Paenibacillus sp. FSL R7-0297]|uniref:LysE family translocator n=1 Tax=unclassified Paenibacillus TaxID=185978 RepID=UPI0030FAF6BD
MNTWLALLSGLSFGFIIAAPVGPMSLLCMNRTLKSGFTAGLATGAGIALADAFYALVTVASFQIVNDFTSAFALPLRLLGSLFLGYLGLKALRPVPAMGEPVTAARSGIAYSMFSAFLLTLANPATLLSFIALAASLGHTISVSLFLPAGIALGSFAWWLLLSGLIFLISGRLPASFSRFLSLSSAILLILFSLYGSFTVLSTYWRQLL